LIEPQKHGEGLEVGGLVGGRHDGGDRNGFDGGGKDEGGLKPAEVETTVPVRLRPKKLSLIARAGRAHVSYCLTRQGQGHGRITWHTSSR
jgi:hypothetical protein